MRRIEDAISHYKTLSLLPNATTPGADIAVIEEILKAEKAVEIALRPLINENSAVSRDTFDVGLQFVAPYLLVAGQMRASLDPRRNQLNKHVAVNPRTEKVSVLCSRLKFLFAIMQHGTPDRIAARLHGFLIVVLEAAGLNCESYHNQPSRLDELSGGVAAFFSGWIALAVTHNPLALMVAFIFGLLTGAPDFGQLP